LGGRCKVAHGYGCAALLPETLRANLSALRARAPGSPALGRYAEVARALGCPGPDEAIEALADLRARLGTPRLGALGAGPDDVAAIVRDARAGSMKTNPVVLTDGELEGILRQAM
jgi:alcohol dehydrogenase